MIARHWHWEFVAYNGQPNAEKTVWGVSVTVIGYENEADALIAAQDVLHRDQYGLRRVWECSSCGYQERTAETMRDLVQAVK
jgi:hypothetical protein